VVIDKPINDRMASTVRHNRARGKHSVSGMASMVFQMLENRWGDAEICAELGLEADELIRLKHVTGFSKLFDDVEYRKAWETNDQIKLRIEADRVKQVARHSSSGSRASAGKADTLDDQYKGNGTTQAPTDKQIAQREKELTGHFRAMARKAHENLRDITCPECGADFFIEKA
jgi:hypothetical protein